MSGNVWCLFAIMVIYMLFMVAIGLYFSKKNKNTSDFYLGGRKLGPFVTAMSAEASDMSSYLLMGLPGLAYISGTCDVGWTAIGLAVGTYLNWLFVSQRLRRYSAKINAITLPEFFSKRYHDDSHAIMAISAIIIVIFFIPYTGSGFAACGKLFSTLFGIDYLPAMIVSAIIIVGYTALGGFLAASTTDLIQSIIMSVALISVVVFGVNIAGGLDVVVDNAKELPGYLSLTQTYDQASGTSSNYGVLTTISTLAWGLGYFGMPHILLRFMGIKDEKKLKLSRRIATTWVVIAMGIAIFIGIIGYSMSKVGAIDALVGSAEAETVIIKCAMLLSKNGVFATIVGGLMLSGILACTMSTADSQLLAASSSISENIMKDCMHIKMDEKKSMLAARITVLIIAVIGIIIAYDPNSSVFGIVSFAWAGFGATFGPAMLMSLFWKRSNRNGVLAGMVAGGIMVFVWEYVLTPLGGIFVIYELLPAFIVNLVVAIVVSLLTAKPSEAIVQEFESVNK